MIKSREQGVTEKTKVQRKKIEETPAEIEV